MQFFKVAADLKLPKMLGFHPEWLLLHLLHAVYQPQFDKCKAHSNVFSRRQSLFSC